MGWRTIRPPPLPGRVGRGGRPRLRPKRFSCEPDGSLPHSPTPLPQGERGSANFRMKPFMRYFAATRTGAIATSAARPRRAACSKARPCATSPRR